MFRYTLLQNVRCITLLLLLGLFAGCTEPPDDERLLRQAIGNIEKAAEDKEIRPILAYLAADFLGNQRLRKANIQGTLLWNFRQNQHIHVYLHKIDIKLNGGQAQVICQLILAGRDEKVVPERARVLVIDSEWYKRDGQWLAVKAQWKDPIYQQ